MQQQIQANLFENSIRCVEQINLVHRCVSSITMAYSPECKTQRESFIALLCCLFQLVSFLLRHCLYSCESLKLVAIHSKIYFSANDVNDGSDKDEDDNDEDSNLIKATIITRAATATAVAAAKSIKIRFRNPLILKLRII